MGWIPEGGVNRLSRPSSVASSPVADGHDDGAGPGPPAPDVDPPIYDVGGVVVSVPLTLRGGVCQLLLLLWRDLRDRAGCEDVGPALRLDHIPGRGAVVRAANISGA